VRTISRAPRRIAFVNEKGGSAKTTLVANLGAHLALNRGRRVLAVDLDPQGQLGKILGVDVRAQRRSAVDLLLDAVLADDPLYDAGAAADTAARFPRVTSRVPRLDVVVANKALALEPGLSGDADAAASRLAAALTSEPVTSSYDLVLLDAPPSFGPLTLAVLRAASEVVIPVPLTFLALDGCAELLRTLHTVRTRYGNGELRVTMVVPTFYRRTRLAHEILDRLKARFPKELAHTVLGFHVKVDEAQSRGLSICEYAPKDRAARAFSALAEELELRAPPSSGEAP